MRLLVVDDEEAMRVALVEALKAEGYRVTSARDGEEALALGCQHEFDLVLLDVMMPKLDGYAVCHEWRKRGRDMPVLMLTARGQVDDRVQGLDSGADDYLVKPFSLKELLARVRALLRRQEKGEAPMVVEIGKVVVNFQKRTLKNGVEELSLSAKECGVLQLLLKYRNEVVSREKFLDEVWEYDASPSTRTVDNFVANLRKKLGAEGGRIESVWGEGYRLDL